MNMAKKKINRRVVTVVESPSPRRWCLIFVQKFLQSVQAHFQMDRSKSPPPNSVALEVLGSGTPNATLTSTPYTPSKKNVPNKYNNKKEASGYAEQYEVQMVAQRGEK